MKSLITRRTAPEIIRLLDFCYKKGVIDACETEDDYAVQEWYDGVFQNGKYGLLTHIGEDFDWKKWRFFLLRWCRENRLSSLGYDYIDTIRQVNGFSYVLLPMAMRFYLMGVGEWLQYPNEHALELFRRTARRRWLNTLPKHMMNMKTDDYISLIQEFVYEFRKHPMPEMSKLSKNALSDFEIAMWQCTRRKHSIYGKIRNNTREEEDI